MSLKDLSTPADVETPSTDNLGGFATLKSGLYKMVIDVAFETKSSKGATGIVLHLKSADPAERAQLRQTLWISSRTGLTYFMGGKDKAKKIKMADLQLFEQILEICTPGITWQNLAQEKKTIKLWNNEMRAEAATEVDTFPELKGKPLYVGIVKVKENKQVLNPKTDKYEPVAEFREFAKIHRVFHTDGFSTEEKKKGGDKAVFVQTWKTKHHEDYVDDSKFKVIPPGAGGGDAASAAAAAAVEVDDGLFD